jgi:hypothetical protein
MAMQSCMAIMATPPLPAPAAAPEELKQYGSSSSSRREFWPHLLLLRPPLLLACCCWPAATRVVAAPAAGLLLTAGLTAITGGLVLPARGTCCWPAVDRAPRSMASSCSSAAHLPQHRIEESRADEGGVACGWSDSTTRDAPAVDAWSTRGPLVHADPLTLRGPRGTTRGLGRATPQVRVHSRPAQHPQYAVMRMASITPSFCTSPRNSTVTELVEDLAS